MILLFVLVFPHFVRTTEPVLEPKEKLFEEMEKAGKDVKTFAAPFLGETVLSDLMNENI